MTDVIPNTQQETDCGYLVDEPSSGADGWLNSLTGARDAMVAGELEQLEALGQQESELGERLEACHRRRGELLAQAARHGLPSDSISQLAQAAAASERRALGEQVGQARARTSLLRHQSLANWVLAQRSLLHLSQLLEILATGGQTKPTYSKEESPHARGNLVDHAA